MDDYILLAQLYDKAQVQCVRALLEQNKIRCKVIFAQNNLETVYSVQIGIPSSVFVDKDDFETAKALTDPLLNAEITDFDIHSYSDSEILEILNHPDEWHESFREEAVKIAKERGFHI